MLAFSSTVNDAANPSIGSSCGKRIATRAVSKRRRRCCIPIRSIQRFDLSHNSASECRPNRDGVCRCGLLWTRPGLFGFARVLCPPASPFARTAIRQRARDQIARIRQSLHRRIGTYSIPHGMLQLPSLKSCQSCFPSWSSTSILVTSLTPNAKLRSSLSIDNPVVTSKNDGNHKVIAVGLRTVNC